MKTIYQIKDLFPNSTGRLVTFFVENTDKDYSIYEIHKHTGISNRQLWRLLRHLEKENIIEISRIVGKVTKMWKLKFCQQAIALIRMEDALK